MVVLRLFQPHNVRWIYASDSPNTGLVMRVYQCQSLSWNQLGSYQSSVGGISRRHGSRKVGCELGKENKASRVTEVIITTAKK